MADPHASDNPFSAPWTTSDGVPAFDRVRPEHFSAAYMGGFVEHEGEIAAIAASTQPPRFDNTIAALERSGQALARVEYVFHLLTGAHSNDALLEIEREMAPQIARHWNKIRTNAVLFRRIDALMRQADTLDLDAEQKRVLERYHVGFRRAGAALEPKAKARLAEIITRLAALGTAFSQNVLADEQAFVLQVEDEAELAGLPDFMRAAMRSAAQERGLDGYAVTLLRSSAEPFLQFAQRRDLREKVFRAFASRGDNGGATDNKKIIAEMVQLRAERAQLLGYDDFAHYRLDDAMAKTPAAARDLLDTVWTPARASALADRDAMQDIVREDGGNFALAPWDWRYYAEKLRQRRCDFDEAAIKPYLDLERMIEAAFYTARRLFCVSFSPRADVPTWHPDVRVWEMRGADGGAIGLFFGDYFARPSKRSGAWMTSLRDQQKLDGDIRPLIVNVMNFSKGAAGEPTLLSFDDARTLFHEFGHALHGLLSAVTYPEISGTNVATDFVELPSQLYEHWLEQPDVLRRFARHYRSGEPIPEELLRRLIAARNFNKGFATVEYIASAFVDLDFHSLAAPAVIDAAAFETQTLARIAMPDEIVMRHRPAQFGHIFSGGGYAAAYYSYMWSEVLDADAFAAFEEQGDIFDPATAKRLHDTIYAAGGSRDPADAYTAFRGRLPTADALLRKRGFADPGGGLNVMDLHSASHRRGVVCAPHFAAAEAGRSILAEGGNALEAMIAMAAAIAAVYPHMNHLGGDGFWLVHEPSGRVRAIMAAGPAGLQARPELYSEYETIPPRGPLAALTVPGAVGGWMLALEAAKANGGALPLHILLTPAIALARNGYAVTRSQARLTEENLYTLETQPGFAETFLVDGKPPAVGATLRQKALAETLGQLAHAGLDDFYRGDVGREIAADLDRIGSPLLREDLEDYHAALAAPLRVDLPTATVYNTDAPTQGVASLMILALFARLGVTEAEGFDHIHGLVEATKRALRARDRAVTDPRRLAHALERCLEARFIAGETMKIDRRKAARWPLGSGKGDTIWMGAADASGLVVSYIQSLYWEFGSGCVLPRTGVLMQNRGISFSLVTGALNLLAPGRLPFHTLNPALALIKDGRIMAYGAMGGDGQPQTQGAVFTRHVVFREPLAEAIDRPRWVLGRTWGGAQTSLRLEPRFDDNLVDALVAAGHDVEVLSEPYSDVMGHAGAAVLHPDGNCEGAHDPRADGGAVGV